MTSPKSVKELITPSIRVNEQWTWEPLFAATDGPVLEGVMVVEPTDDQRLNDEVRVEAFPLGAIWRWAVDDECDLGRILIAGIANDVVQAQAEAEYAFREAFLTILKYVRRHP